MCMHGEKHTFGKLAAWFIPRIVPGYVVYLNTVSFTILSGFLILLLKVKFITNFFFFFAVFSFLCLLYIFKTYIILGVITTSPVRTSKCDAKHSLRSYFWWSSCHISGGAAATYLVQIENKAELSRICKFRAELGNISQHHCQLVIKKYYLNCKLHL